VFSSVVTDFWMRGVALTARPDRVHVVVDTTLTESRSVSLVDVTDGPQILALSPARAAALGLADGDERLPADIEAALSEARVTLNDPDAVFHLTTTDAGSLAAERPPAGVRPLTADDQADFDRLIAASPEDDVDEAYVELDHWLVFGHWVDGRIVSAASMYPWDDSTLADTGVLTAPDYRGRGLGSATVRAMNARALELGFEPQYRCQLDNHASVALARSAGLTQFGSWKVILPGE
jgi:GNAT superfamily N-acetyltransferase